jgi:aldehyde:ferredoxin oxidoreductase
MLGDMPQKYWTQAAFEGVERISGARMSETILTGKTACQGCVICCGRAVTINDGPHATGGEVKGPEYETVALIQLLVDDLPAIVALANRCDAVGITRSAQATHRAGLPVVDLASSQPRTQADSNCAATRNRALS